MRRRTKIAAASVAAVLALAAGAGGGDGSGLGLALVRQQARLHGGEAWVDDSSLGGARFVARLAATGAGAERDLRPV